MSLAGLDSPEVDKAYQTVQAEKAGWSVQLNTAVFVAII